VTYTFQVFDDTIRITVQLPGKYNPDILEDGKRRALDLYKEALQTRVDIVGTADELLPEKDEPSE
jgi:hypothetical protein